MTVEFKPLLSCRGLGQSASPRGGSHGQASDQPRAAVLELVGDASQLYQKQCVRLLAGDALEATFKRDRSYGRCASASKAPSRAPSGR
jgi:hypothetical protein